MTRQNWRMAGIALVAFGIAASTSLWIGGRATAAQTPDAGMAAMTPSEPVPTFQVDPSWLKLPNNWVLGNVSQVLVDAQNNVWILHRPHNPSLVVPPGKTAAPPVLEYTASGKFIQGWGGPDHGYDWPDTEHNIAVYNGVVWISGSSPNNSRTSRSDDMIIRFTTKGKFLSEMGGHSVSLGNLDTKSVNKPGGLFLWPKTGELFVADGYGNRRVIVFDAATLTFKRMWAAFGKPVTNVPGSGGRGTEGGPALAAGARGESTGPKVPDTVGPGSPNFALPHGIAVSNDGIVYVTDRPNRRIQLFTPAGKYITQVFINRAGPSGSSASDIAFSPDKAQKFLYVADYGNSRIVVMDRKQLKILYQFGKRGAAPGDFQGVHKLAVDAQGNIYTAEVAPGHRLQKFIFKGMSSTLPANALTPAELAPSKK